MTVYEEDKREAAQGAASPDDKEGGKGKKKKGRNGIGLFEPRVSLWLVMPSSDDGTILYAAPTKKEAYSAAAALTLRHFLPHYSAWLPLHGHPNDPRGECGIKSDAWAEYVAANADAVNGYLSTLLICRAKYGRGSICAILRMLCGVAPLGLPGETDEEVEYWLAQAAAILAEDEANRKKEEEEEAAEAEKELAAKKRKKEEAEKAPAGKKSAAPLDKRPKKDHNVSEKKTGSAQKKKAAPRKGAAKNGNNGKDGKQDGKKGQD